MNLANHDSKKEQLRQLARKIDTNADWWRFPTQDPIQGFLGTAPIFIVGDQPSTSEWGISHPNRMVFYRHLQKVGAANAHLTDLYKKRGRSGALRQGLPEDFEEHLVFFRKEIEILQPTRVVALGQLAYDLLVQHAAELRPMLRRMWHFSYVVRSGRLSQYEANMRRAICGAGELGMATSVKAEAVSWLVSKFGVVSDAVYASKFYISKKSRTHRSAWWLEISRAAIETPKSAEFHLLCQVAPGAKEFHCLKVPVGFFKKELQNLCVRKKGKTSLVSLFLSAEPGEMFVDQRGVGQVHFSDFLMKC